MRLHLVLLPLGLLLPACEQQALSVLMSRGIEMDLPFDRTELSYPQYQDDPRPYTFGSGSVKDDLRSGENPLDYHYVLLPIDARYNFTVLGNPTILQGADPDGGSTPRDYYELRPGGKLDWQIAASLSFDQPLETTHTLNWGVYDDVPSTVDEADSFYLDELPMDIHVNAPVVAPGLLELDAILNEIDPQLATDRPMFTWATPIRLPVFHSDGIQFEIPDEESEILRFGIQSAVFDQALIDTFGLKFPQGTGSFGVTAFAQPSLALTPGDYAVAYQVRRGPLDLTDPAKKLQIGFVFDRDLDGANNFRAGLAFPKDLFDNSERWANGSWDFATGLQLQYQDASTSPPTTLSSTARLIQSGHVSVLVVARSEVTNAAEVAYRVTLFKHTGDFGLSGGPFKVDTAPYVGEPLALLLTW
jgi:hypothetical protein